MNKLTNIMSTILIVCGLSMGNTVGAQPYLLDDLKGSYGFAMDGVITITDDSSGVSIPIPIPTSTVGRIVFKGDTDGDGVVELVASGYYNIGGFAILAQTTAPGKPGTYTIGANTGIGSVTMEAIVVGQPEFPLGVGALPAAIDASEFMKPVIFEFRFVMGKADGEFDLIGTSLSTVEEGSQTAPIGAIVTRGRAWPQAPKPAGQ
ncbi:MAG: hypothetical protein ABFS45_07690 [Pseudomonadota bacterium]